MDDNMNYNKYLKSNSQDDYSDAIALIECIVFIEACIDNTLNEGVVDSSKAFLSKISDLFKNKV
jgi:hypothetical protein